MIGEVWEFVVEKVSEGWEYIVESFSGLFTGLKEFSPAGTIAGAIMIGLLFLARNQILTPFTKNMPGAQGIITTIICYVGVFGVGYLMMSRAMEQG